METVRFEHVVSRGCGLDVHKETVVATIDGEGLEHTTRKFGTFTRSLTELKDWLWVLKTHLLNITENKSKRSMFTDARCYRHLSRK